MVPRKTSSLICDFLFVYKKKRGRKKDKFYISTAIAYTSAKPHIGNTYEVVLADAIARFKRLQGYDVYFQTGTDEHGEKIEGKALEANVTPQEYVDNIACQIKDIWDVLPALVGVAGAKVRILFGYPTVNQAFCRFFSGKRLDKQ